LSLPPKQFDSSAFYKKSNQTLGLQFLPLQDNL